MTLTGFIEKVRAYLSLRFNSTLQEIAVEDGVSLSPLQNVTKQWSDPYSLSLYNTLFLLPGTVTEDDDEFASVPVDLVFAYLAEQEPDWQTACHDAIKRLIRRNPDFEGLCFEVRFVKTTPYEPVNGIGVTHMEIVLKVDSLF